MQIRSGQGRGLPNIHKKKEGEAEKLTGLKKSEVIHDLFNNRGRDEKQHQIKIQLSQTSKSLSQDLEEKVFNFFRQEKKMASLVEQMPLGESPYQTKQSSNLLRKTRAYLRWLEIHENKMDTLEESESNLPLEIYKMGKDEELKSFFEENDTLRRQVNEQRKINTPNYYYLIYPETYSFN